MTHFEYNLVPCRRGHEPSLRPLPDLTTNLHVAQRIVDRMETFFQFSTAWPIFSGHARVADGKDGPNHLLYAQMVGGDGAYRSFAFQGTGFVGVVNIQEPNSGPVFFTDYLYGIEEGLMNHCRSLADGWAEGAMGLLVGDDLVVHIPCRW